MAKKRILIVEDDKDQQLWLYEKLSQVYECVPLKGSVDFETLQKTNKDKISDVVSDILSDPTSKPDLMIFDVCLTSIDHDNAGLDILREVRRRFHAHTYTPVIILTRKSLDEVKMVLNESNTSIESYPMGMISTFYVHKPQNDLTKYEEGNPESVIFLGDFLKIVEMLCLWHEISSPELAFKQFLYSLKTDAPLKSVFTEELRPVHTTISYLFEAINADSVSLDDLSKKLFRIFSQEIKKLKAPDENMLFECFYASLVTKLDDSFFEGAEVIRREKKSFIDAIRTTFGQETIEPIEKLLDSFSLNREDVMGIQKQLLQSIIDCLFL